MNNKALILQKKKTKRRKWTQMWPYHNIVSIQMLTPQKILYSTPIPAS